MRESLPCTKRIENTSWAVFDGVVIVSMAALSLFFSSILCSNKTNTKVIVFPFNTGGLVSKMERGPCNSLSDPARDFLLQSLGATWETVDLSPVGLSQLRQENSEVASRGWKSVAAEFVGVKIENEVLSSISVQWVIPEAVLGPEVVLYLFGGGFVVGSPDDDLCMTARLATRMGRRVCVPRYRLAPEHPFPAAFDDVSTVFDELTRNGGFVFVVGESAGGNLALKLLQTCHLEFVVAVALFSPWIDLSHSGDSHLVSDGLDPTLSKKHFLEPASQAYAGGLPVSSPDISPLFGSFPPCFPPVIITTATRDLLLRWPFLFISYLLC